MEYRFVLADVFSERPFGGNPLAVVTDARGMATETMQAVAREFNFSETTFVLPPRDPAHTCRVRIFTPAAELPFAGHPSVGTAVVLATGATPWPAHHGRLVMEEGIGPVAAEVDGAYAAIEVAAPLETAPEQPTAAAVAAALSVDAAEVRACWGAGVGLPFCFVQLADAAAVDRAELDRAGWAAELAGAWADNPYLFAGEPGDGAELYARAFVPGLGVAEDPATGSACAGLVASLAARAGAVAPEFTVRVRQGVRMGRPGLITATAHLDGGRLTGVRVGGHTAVVGSGTLSL